MMELNIKKDTWNTNTKFMGLRDIYSECWDMLFKIAKLGDLSKPLTPQILSNPRHKITKHIIYLYSMESFIY